MPDHAVLTHATKGGSLSSEPGSTRYLKFPEKRTPDRSHDINRTAFIADLVGTPKSQKCEDVVVHSSNVTHADLIKRHRRIYNNLAKADYKGNFPSFDDCIKPSPHW